MKYRLFTIGLAVLIFLFALLLTLYPLISSAYNARHQSEIRTEYQAQLQAVDDGDKQRAWELAAAYNASLVPGVQMAESYSAPALLWASEDYDAQLNLTGSGVMGYLSIPAIGAELPIYHGTSDETLSRGVGHLLGSSLPVGGESTHAVLTGHSGMASQKLFSDLDQLDPGDVFYLDVLGQRLAYEVDQIKTVLPFDTTYLQIENGADYCTLITCTPFGVNTHRLLVRGRRIAYKEDQVNMEKEIQKQAPAPSTWQRQYRMGLLGGAALALLAGFGVLLHKWLRRGKYGRR